MHPIYFLLKVMSIILRNKSVINYDAAFALKESPNYHHCSSIHCSYYSCFQAVKHIIINILGVDDSAIYSNRRIDPANIKSEHEYVIEYVHRRIIELDKLEDAKAFKNKINQLKSIRTNSDYKEITIEKEQSDAAYCLASEVITTLKKTFSYER